MSLIIRHHNFKTISKFKHIWDKETPSDDPEFSDLLF